MITYLDLQNEFYRYVDEATGTASSTTNLAKDFINRSHRRLLLSRTWPFMVWPREETFTTVANVRTYALHPAMGKLLTMWDSTTQQYYPAIPRREWQDSGANRSQNNQYPVGYVYGPVWPVAAQPGGYIVTIVSSASQDTGGPTLIIRGITTADNLVTETITLTGTTPVNSTNIFNNILNVSKTGTWVGTVTLTSNAVTILSLGATEYGKAYPTIEFIENPQVGLPFLYTFTRTPMNLVNDYDIPETWPNELAEIHVYDALLDMTAYNTELGAKEQGLWKRRYDELYNQLLTTSDEAIAGSQPRFVRSLDGWGRTNMSQVRIG